MSTGGFLRWIYGSRLMVASGNTVVESKFQHKDATSNFTMLHQISTTELFGTSIDESNDTVMVEQSTSNSSQIPHMPNFVVGLNNLVNDIKQILLYQKGVNIIGIKGIGGS